MQFEFVLLFIINISVVFTGRCPSKGILSSCNCSSYEITCQSAENLREIFQLMSEELDNLDEDLFFYSQRKHFIKLNIGSRYNNFRYLEINQAETFILNESSFADITFEEFNGYDIKLIHQNAFGKSTETIKKMHIEEGYVNHSPPEYHIWNAFSGLVNVREIYVCLNVTEIPSKAFRPLTERQSNFTDLTIWSNDSLTIEKMAFYYLDNLTNINIGHHTYQCSLDFINAKLKIKKIEKEAFAFEKQSNQTLKIHFLNCEFDYESFPPGLFDGLQRPVQIQFYNSNIKILPESTFKSLLNNINNINNINNVNDITTLLKHMYFGYLDQNSFIDCFDCRNQWLVRDNIIPHLRCSSNTEFSLFSLEIESYFKSKCNLTFTSKKKSEINYFPCEHRLENDMLSCPSNITNIQKVFRSFSRQLNQSDKHFSWLNIFKADDPTKESYLILDKDSFWDITFDNFAGSNIKFIDYNAFGKTAKTIKKLIIWNGTEGFNRFDLFSNLDKDKWNFTFFNAFINAQHINIHLDNIKQIPSQAFNQSYLNTFKLSTQNKLIIGEKAFYSQENLKELHFQCEFDKIESQAFAFNKISSEKLLIVFENFTQNAFDPESFTGLQRPVHIVINNSVDYIPESTFQIFLDNQNNITMNSYINCFDCRNFWMIRDQRDKQVFGSKCKHKNDLTLFNSKIKCYLETKCLPNEYFSLFNEEKKSYCNDSNQNYYNNFLIISLIIIAYFNT